MIGCGYWGPNHIRNFNSLVNCNMLMCCDSDVRRLEHMKRLYPYLETTTEAEDLFNDNRLDAMRGVAQLLRSRPSSQTITDEIDNICIL